MQARMIEIFSSIQGEGIYVGYRQLFLRFFGCNLRCVYCDTLQEQCPSQCRIELNEMGSSSKLKDNPLSSRDLMNIITSFPLGLQHSVSLTGGEPLLHWEFLREFLPVLTKETGLKIFLETNGTLPEELKEILPWIDYTAMDFKLPGSLGGKEYLQEHLEFLTLSLQKNVFVKIVITENSSRQELLRYLKAIKSVCDYVPVVLQPVTSNSGGEGVSKILLMDLQKAALTVMPGVRVIPQIHKIMGYL